MEGARLRNKLIIGGTGTLGRALLERFPSNEVVVFSRDELKQHELRHKYPTLKTIIGDIRDPKSLELAMDGITDVFHVAALKHVDILEDNPYEAHRTNVIGTMNSAEAAKKAGVKNFYFTSTDKAVMPINVYGMTKAISERYLLNQNSDKPFSTSFKVFRWGNIVGSRGSVVNLFAKTLKDEGAVYVTDPRMTRFWMLIDEAIDFMLGFKGDDTKINFPDMKAATVLDLAKAVADCLGISEYEVKTCGIRPGEKLHECLYSTHAECIRSDTAPRLTHEELASMVKPLVVSR